jgi:iron-sulfur cluster assembly accessory protein
MSKDVFNEMLTEANKEIAKFSEERENAPSLEQMQEKSGAVITLTSKAAEKVKEFMKAEEKPVAGLRVGAAPGGCSGFQYVLEFEEAPSEDDAVYEQNGLKIFINKQQMQMLHGVRIDFVDGLQGTGFKIENPNASKTCGCGQSFH